MNDFPLLPSVEPALRGPATEDIFTDAARSLVGRCAKERATSGMSASEAEVTAVEMVAEVVGTRSRNLSGGRTGSRFRKNASPATVSHRCTSR